jgi:ankyrin repeat protein
MAHASNDLTRELQNYLFSLEVQSVDASLPEVRNFIVRGANPHALGPTGGNAAHVAIESWAYASMPELGAPFNAAKEAELFAIIRYLAVDLGVDVSAPDWRGLSPLYNVLRFGSRDPAIYTKMVDLLVGRGVDLNAVGPGGLNLMQLLSTGARETDLFRLLGSGMELRGNQGRGRLNFAVRSAGKRPAHGETLLLQRLLEKLPEAERAAYAELAAEDGATPIHFAARNRNLPAIQYLIETYRVDINKKTLAGETALSIALSLGDSASVAYLRSQGALEAPNAGTLSNCSGENPGRLDYEKVVKIVQDCKVLSINQLLPLLPATYRSNYTLAYGTLAVQEASPEYPQVITFGDDGKLMMAFNGHRSQRGYRNLEMLQFRDSTKTFELREIEFPRPSEAAAGKKPHFSAANPPRCLSCHDTSPRPLWDSWTFWPGKFFGEMDHAFPAEAKLLAKFAPNRVRGRYQHLPEASLGPIHSVFGAHTGYLYNQNNKMDFFVESLLSEKMSRELATTPALKPWRYALLAALSCRDSLDEFIPESARSQLLPLSDAYLLADTIQKGEEEIRIRYQLLRTFLGAEPQGRYVVVGELVTRRQPEQAGRNFDVVRTARLRRIVEGLGISMSGWFSPFNMNRPSYSVFKLSRLEALLWQETLSAVDPQDGPLYASFSQAFQAQKGNPIPNSLFFETPNSPEAGQICLELKSRSNAALRHSP